MKSNKHLSWLAVPAAAAIAATVGLGSAYGKQGQAPCEKGLSSCAPTGLKTSDATYAGYTLVFHDEFSGTTLDSTKWNVGWTLGTMDPKHPDLSGPVNTAETACYNAKNVQVSDGYLHLKLTNTPSTCNNNPDGTPLQMANTGAHVNTYRKFEFSRGIFETRIYIEPRTDGTSGCANFSSAWTDGHTWPVDGELDLYECKFGHADWHVIDENPPDDGDTVGTISGWHTMSYEWDATTITFRYDGKAVGTYPYTKKAVQYIILMNTSGSLGGPDVTPSDFKVDYVRVWQKK